MATRADFTVPMNHATVTKDGYTVPLIGIPELATIGVRTIRGQGLQLFG